MGRIRKFLCSIGLHQWFVKTDAEPIQLMDGQRGALTVQRERTCVYCRKHQISYYPHGPFHGPRWVNSKNIGDLGQ